MSLPTWVFPRTIKDILKNDFHIFGRNSQFVVQKCLASAGFFCRKEGSVGAVSWSSYSKQFLAYARFQALESRRRIPRSRRVAAERLSGGFGVSGVY